MLIKKVFNKYDIIIIILLASLAFGLIGGALQLSRLLAILFAPMMVSRIVSCKLAKIYLQVFFIFIGYSALSLLWSYDKGRGVEEMIYYIVHFIYFFEILVFSIYAINPANSISKGWMFAVVMTLVVALWEITTDNHLALSLQESDLLMNTGTEILVRNFASVTFGNYNSYVTFLCLALPFVFYRMMRMTNFKLKNILPIVTLLFSVVCILFNASRGGLIAVAIMFAIYFFMSPKNKYSFLLLILMIIAGAFTLLYFGENMLLAIVAKSSEGGLFEDSSRIEIWEVALKTFVASWGFGTGIGGLQQGMSHFTNGITIPHNVLLEILAQFGILICFIFILFYSRLLLKMRKTQNLDMKRLLYIALFSFPVIAIINSSYLLNVNLFAYFATIIIYINYARVKPAH